MAEKLLKVCVFNVENLFLSMEYYRGENLSDLSEMHWKDFALPQLRQRQKPLRKLWGLSRAFLDIQADIFLLTEVGGRESLENFNHHFLNDGYVPHFVDGNSSRAIDLAFLVKRDFPQTVFARSNRHLPVEVKSYQGNYTARFSRDVAEMRVGDPDRPSLILLLTHLKSKISSDDDFHGKDRRTAEAAALAAFYEQRRQEFGAPVIVGGDFNTTLASEELAPLRATDLGDFQDWLARPAQERITYVHFDYRGEAHVNALDYLLLSPDLRPALVEAESFAYRYKGFYEIPDPLPESLREKFRMPSDHYPVVVTLKLPLP